MMIGEAAARSGVASKAIRFYEQAGLIEPARRLANGYRAYDGAGVQTLRFIHRARGLGFSLEEIRKLLALYRDHRRSSKDIKRLALAHVADLDRKIAELTSIRETVAALARRCHGEDRPECPILEDLEGTPVALGPRRE
ncbi:MAG: Cu(I)-responsive transcriptional regulator [Steroidobacteraceae bacterium]